MPKPTDLAKLLAKTEASTLEAVSELCDALDDSARLEAVRLLNANPLADGIFMDNAIGKVPFPGISVIEPTGTYSIDSGGLIAAVNRAIAPQRR